MTAIIAINLIFECEKMRRGQHIAFLLITFILFPKNLYSLRQTFYIFNRIRQTNFQKGILMKLILNDKKLFCNPPTDNDM